MCVCMNMGGWVAMCLSEQAKECQQLDTAMLEKKEELSQFQTEYLEVKSRFHHTTSRHTTS